MRTYIANPSFTPLTMVTLEMAGRPLQSLWSPTTQLHITITKTQKKTLHSSHLSFNEVHPPMQHNATHLPSMQLQAATPTASLHRLLSIATNYS